MMQFSYISFLCFTLIYLRTAISAEEKFFYEIQNAWHDVPAVPKGTNQCSGSKQSPVNINSAEHGCQPNAISYTFYNGDCTLGDYDFTVSDHGLKASIENARCDKPKMLIPGVNKLYEFQQFHIHTGCENKLDGMSCDVNLHMVHKAESITGVSPAKVNNDLPDLSVIDLMMQGVNEYHEEIDPLIQRWSEVSCSSGGCSHALVNEIINPFSPYSLIPTDTAIYNFQGSLTTPPCWEVVNWNVAEKPVLISYKQVLALANMIIRYSGSYNMTTKLCLADTPVADIAGLTARHTQPLNGRTIVKNCNPHKMMNFMTEHSVENATTINSMSIVPVMKDIAISVESGKRRTFAYSSIESIFTFAGAPLIYFYKLSRNFFA